METTYSISNSALVLVDVLNDFLAEDGKLGGMIGPVLEKHRLRTNLGRLLEGARKAGLKTIYVAHGLDDHGFDDFRHIHPRFQFGIENKVSGMEPTADFYEPSKPREGDVVVGRHRIRLLRRDRTRRAPEGKRYREDRPSRPYLAGLHRRHRPARAGSGFQRHVPDGRRRGFHGRSASGGSRDLLPDAWAMSSPPSTSSWPRYA